MAHPGRKKRQAETEVLYGKHAVKAAVRNRPGDIARILLAGKESYHTEIFELAETHGIEAALVPWPDFLRAGNLSRDTKHQGVLALATHRPIYGDRDLDRLAGAGAAILLDQMSNPQNLATILRSAAFFHIDAVLFMRHRSATPTPEVVRFAAGGAEFVELYRITNVAQALDGLRDLGFQALGLDERGEHTLADHSMGHGVVFVVGAEGEGLRPRTREHCSDLVRIQGGREGLESLNSAVAATVAMYEHARLRLA